MSFFDSNQSKAVAEKTIAHAKKNSTEDSLQNVIAQHYLSFITHETMMEDLLSREYTEGYVPAQPMWVDAYVRGTWDDLRITVFEGLLDEDDYLRIIKAKRN